MTPVFQRFFGEHRRLLCVLLGVLAFNGVLQLIVNRRLDSLLERADADRLASRKEAVDAVREWGRAGLESLLLASARDRVGSLNSEILRSNAARFPVVDRKIKAIAKQFGLASQSYAYSYVPMPKENLEQLTVSFNMKGSYTKLCQFIAEVEKARGEDGEDLFFAIEQVSLKDSTDKGTELNLTLVITTYFYKPAELVTKPASPGKGRTRPHATGRSGRRRRG